MSRHHDTRSKVRALKAYEPPSEPVDGETQKQSYFRTLDWDRIPSITVTGPKEPITIQLTPALREQLKKLQSMGMNIDEAIERGATLLHERGRNDDQGL